MLICAQERVGKEIVEPVFTPLHEPVRSSAGSKYCASDNLLAVFVAELFAVLHPATLPMLERMFEDVRWRNGPASSKPLARFDAMGGALARGRALRPGGRPSN